MANDYDTQIAAIEAAITAFAGQPQTVTVNGRSVSYPTMKSLTDALEALKQSDTSGTTVRQRLKFATIKSGSAYG
jgi:hypothetical protein